VRVAIAGSLEWLRAVENESALDVDAGIGSVSGLEYLIHGETLPFSSAARKRSRDS